MARCVVCEYPIPEDRDRVGARCPSCHEPLYEPPGRMARPPREGEASCAVHPAMGSIGLCARCGKHLCETCRTRWRGLILCAVCVDRALSTSEATPAQTRAGNRQAKRSAILAVVVWVIALAAIITFDKLATPGERSAVVTTFIVLLVLVADTGLAAFAVGQSVAALRVPAISRMLPLAGLAVAGLYVAVVLGLGIIGLW